MRRNFTQSFKVQAVEKALNNSHNKSIKEVADSLDVGYSTLTKWITQAKNQTLEANLEDDFRMTKDRRPQDWTAEERMDAIVSSSSLNEDQLSQFCREQGIYVHHIDQWKQDFINPNNNVKPASKEETKFLKHENKKLKKEINRKDRALAETAALLVLQKKVNDIWGCDEDS